MYWTDNNRNINIKWARKPVLYLFLLYTTAMLTIIRANAYYADDIGRAYSGARNWYDWGRYIPEYLSPFIHTSTRLQDISPLTQLIALLFCAAAGVILIFVITGKKEVKALQLIAMMPLAINPHFLGCLSYKYDSPYMGLSVLLSVIPLLFADGRGNGYKKYISYFAVSLVCALGMCLSYQASSCVFPIVVIFLLLKKWCDGEPVKDILLFGAVSAVSFLAGQLLFKLIILDSPAFINEPGFYSPGEMIPGWIANIRLYFTRVFSWWNRIWIVLTGLLVISAFVLFIRDSGRNKALTAIVCLAGMGCMTLCLFGSYAALRELDNNPRMMYGIGIMIAVLGCFVVSSDRMYAGKTVCVLLAWCFFVFFFQYGNALAEQKRYVEFRSGLIISDLIHTDVMNEAGEKTIEISGEMGLSDVIENMNYGMVKALLKHEFEGGAWDKTYLRYYFKLESLGNVRPYDGYEEIPFEKDDLPLLIDTPYHAIYGADRNLWIELK